MKLKKFLALILLALTLTINISFATEITEETKYPDYAELYLGKDKLEKFNRKVFNFNLKLNSYVLRPIHILWASIMPQYGMDRIYSMTKNIEYPIRLMSTLIQRDFKSAGTETVRFLTNTTLGLGGMFNPAERLFNMCEVDENMEQALAKCKVKQGTYMVIPILSSTTPRNMCGKLLDSIFNPSSYIGTPLIAAVKAILTINRTYYLQPLVHMIESNYADAYDIAKKIYGLENHIKCSNYDRLHIVKKWATKNKKGEIENEKLATPHPIPLPLGEGKESDVAIPKNISCHSEASECRSALPSRQNLEALAEESNPHFKHQNAILKDENISEVNVLKGSAEETDIVLKNRKGEDDGIALKPDIVLSEYNPQTPVIDSMRTAMFELSDNYKSIWADFSIWNKAFYKRLKTASIEVYPQCPKYKYRYLLQKTNSPVAVIYPSIGDGAMSTHAAKFAKIFYDKGYSVVILSSHFNWEFAHSMPQNYYPGNPSVDVEYVKYTTDKILANLEQKHHIKFDSKTTLGTSFGALMTLYLAEKEYTNDTKNKYIAICPPVELLYAMKQADKISEHWKNSPDTVKDDIALTAEKIVEISNIDNLDKIKINSLPFNDDEARLITGFILHQKLSDLIYTKKIRANSLPNHCERTVAIRKDNNIYETISKTNYNDYAKQNLISDKCKTLEALDKNSSLHKLSTYLINANNYKIYHSIDDYLTNPKQLKQLKMYTGTKSVYFSNGAHLGFLYRPEFLNDLKSEINY